ncbi:MAG TPA: alpha/beta fold hydrolase [Candidatus Dormibacteraeota bacterium]|nr:alpha/beta fold hydrolase [Candidatus Dormibacteraeota bacterium]
MHDLYAEGLRIAQTIKDLDGPNVNPLCHTRLYTHGRRSDRSLVLLHGFTNCPQQMDALGRVFFDKGWNVFIPRYPRHGYSDRLTTAIAELRADHLTAVANRAAEVGAALGEHCTVAGLSLGAILAGLMAHERVDIDRAVLIAPMLGLRSMPAPVFSALGRIAPHMPNVYLWWDRKQKDRIGPPYGYPRLSTHAVAALLQCGRTLVEKARRDAPRARSIAVITNAAEPRLDNRSAYSLIKSWREHGATVETIEFPVADHLPHDLIDPADAAQNTELVYPVVAAVIEGTSTSRARARPA